MLSYAEFASETIPSKQCTVSYAYRKLAYQCRLTNGVSVLVYERGGRSHVAIRDASISLFSLEMGKMTPSS